MSVLKPFVDWANSVLDSADGGTYIPPAGSLMSFQTTLQPLWHTHDNDLFAPGHYLPSDMGLEDLIAEQVESEMEANVVEARIFARQIRDLIHELESFENWIEQPLQPNEMLGLHSVLHTVLGELAEKNNFEMDVEKWENEKDRLDADRLLLAVAYVLAWQPYSIAVQFVWGLAKPWYVRLSEVIGEQIDNAELSYLAKPLTCLRERVQHFDALLFSFLEGTGSFESEEEICVDDDVDATTMYRTKRTYRDEDGNIVEDDE